jgi:hypothetical protein
MPVARHHLGTHMVLQGPSLQRISRVPVQDYCFPGMYYDAYFPTLPVLGCLVPASISMPITLGYLLCLIPVAWLCNYWVTNNCSHVMFQGSAKSGILGEILLNLSNFLNLADPTAISLPLKRCNSGTVLQVCFATPPCFQWPLGHCLHDLVAKNMLVLHSNHSCQQLCRSLFHACTFW